MEKFVSTTPKLPDECKRLLDNGWIIVLRKSALEDYVAMAIGSQSNVERRVTQAVGLAMLSIPDNQLTGDFEPSQALTRLPEKVFGCKQK